jgi:soluble lytic murein transglycosylase-like protein
MRAAFLTCALALIAAAAPVQASNFPQANNYFEVRDRAPAVIETFDMVDVQTQVQKFAGKLVEVKGPVTGVFDSNTQGSILIQPKDGPAITINFAPGKRLSDYPMLDVGNTVRVLCQVIAVGENSPSGLLVLQIPVKEYEAAKVEVSRKEAADKKLADEKNQKAAIARRQTGAQANLGSRGMSGSAVRSSGPYSRAQLIGLYGDAVRYFNRHLSVGEAQKIARLILDYSNRYRNLDARLVMAVIACESNFNANAVSPVGAMGLGQLMPGTAAGLGVSNAWDPSANLAGSTKLLSSHLQDMSAGGRPDKEAIKLALACYNAGAGAVRKYKGIPPYRETQNYVRKIIRLYWSMLPTSERSWSPD